MNISNNNCRLYIFKTKIDEAVSLMPDMTAEEKLRAVQFWNLVSEKLQEIVNNSAADINALAMRFEEEKLKDLKSSNLMDTTSSTLDPSLTCTDLTDQLSFNSTMSNSAMNDPIQSTLPLSALDAVNSIDQMIAPLYGMHPSINQSLSLTQTLGPQNNDLMYSMEHVTRTNVIQSAPKQRINPFDGIGKLGENDDGFESESENNIDINDLIRHEKRFCDKNFLDDINESSSTLQDIVATSSEEESKESRLRNFQNEENRSFVCDICHKPLPSSSALVSHRWIHTKPYSCSECDAKFSNKGNLSVHQRRHTGEKPFSCDKCPATFSTKGNLKRHIKAHSGERPWECDLCGSKFTEKKSLKVHMRRHTGEKPYKCDVCNKAFSQTGVLQTHMALHLDERKHLCEMCGKAFRQRSQLKLHSLRHEGVKKWDCSKCTSKFLTKGDLERHFRVHTGERPFICDLCGKTFTRQQSLNEHSNRHNGIKPYSCVFCNKKFSEMSACYKHIKIHKKQEKSDELSIADLDALQYQATPSSSMT